MSSENDKFVQEFRRFLESRGTSSTSSQRFQSASSVASEMRSDATLAQNVAQVFQNTRDGVQSGIWTNPPQLPTLSQPAAGRQVGRGRKRKAQKSYSIKLVIVDYLKEVAETGITNNFRSTPLMEAPLTVFENEQDASIRKKVLSMIKSRYSAYDGDYYYASRSGKKTNLNLMPRQNLTGKELNTLKAKSTNSLYVMLKKPANGNEEPDEEEDERDEYENETTDTGLLTFEVPAKRNQRTQSTNRDLGFEFRQNYLRTVTENADSSDEDTSSCDGEGTSGEDSRGRNPSNQPIKKPFTGHSGVQFKEGNAFIPTAFCNPDGNSCAIAATLVLLQHLEPFMKTVNSKKGPVCTILEKIYQLRGVNDIRVVRLYKDLMSLLKITSAGFKDPNEILQKLLATLLDEEDSETKVFCGKPKSRITLNSSTSQEIVVESADESGQNKPVHHIGIPTATKGTPSIRDLLNVVLMDSEKVPNEKWSSEWKRKYSSDDGNLYCTKHAAWELPPSVLALCLQRGKPLCHETDHRMIKIPIAIPHLDLLKPEDECIHSIDTEDNSSLLYGMVVHSRRRSHFYTVLRLEMSSDTWIVYDDLKTYEVEMTDTLLNDLGGGEHRDLSISFIYVDKWDSIVVKAPFPETQKQKDILSKLGHNDTDNSVFSTDNDETEVDYQRIFNKIEEKTRDFVGLTPLKEQFLRFAKTAILNEKRKRLGFNVDQNKSAIHFVFQGNPGTGKTTFARKVADLLHSIKRIKKRKVVEVQRADLVGQYLGATEKKTEGKIREAKGGVLFIDEAYRLTPRSDKVDYGRVAINQLMSSMECGDPVMIFAGYPKEMEDFMKVNPGLKSRVKYLFTFPDYSVDELGEILLRQIKENGFLYDGDRSSLSYIIEQNTTLTCRTQQNGRLITNVFSEAVISLSDRLSFEVTGPAIVTLQDMDIAHGCQMFGGSSMIECAENKDPEAPEEQTMVQCQEQRKSPVF